MQTLRRLAAAAVAAGLVLSAAPPPARAQALPSLASVSVGYATQKRTVKPDGDLKAQIDALDREIAEATRLGRTGELRRLYAKGQTLLSGRAWTDELEFSRSLAIRTDRVVVDAAVPWAVRLEQIYLPSIALERPIVARVTLRRPAAAARGGGAAPAAPGPVTVKELGTRDGVSRDLRESPLGLTLDLAGTMDGRYQLAIEVLDGTRSLGTALLAIEVRNGVDAAVDRLRRAAAAAPESLRASILYPVDRMQVVNRGAMALGTFNPAADFAAAEAVATAAAAGTNPFDGKTGDFKRHYRLESAGEIMPYRIYVPAACKPAAPCPLVMALHGLGGTEDAMFDGYGGVLPKLAEQHGFILAAPLGYRVDGFYGWEGNVNRDDPEALRNSQRSEDDVMQVLQQVRRLYTVDPARIYLMGHSMGAIGTWHLGSKYPDIWAALGPISGIGTPATAERMKQIPQFVVHGDADTTVRVENSRVMVDRMKALGMTVTYIEVPGGDHINVAAPNLPAMFEFFKQYKKTP